MKPRIAAVHASNYGVYGAREVWLTLNRKRPADEQSIARCTVERLMGELGLAGAARRKLKRTTISDPKAPKPLDLVDRNFAPLAPDQLWVADFTYVSTWSGWGYTAFVIDAYARRILGWSVATTMTSQLVVDAAEQAIWTRGREGKDLAGLIAHHDHGVQYLSASSPSSTVPNSGHRMPHGPPEHLRWIGPPLPQPDQLPTQITPRSRRLPALMQPLRKELTSPPPPQLASTAPRPLRWW